MSRLVNVNPHQRERLRREFLLCPKCKRCAWMEALGGGRYRCTECGDTSEVKDARAGNSNN